MLFSPAGDQENLRAKKTYGPAISASLGLATSYGPFITYTINGVAYATGQWLDIGNAPGIDVTLAFTHGATAAVLSVLAVFANAFDRTVDPTVGAPPPYIPAASATGVTPAYPNELTFSKSDWTTSTSPLSSSSVKYVRGYLHSNGCRLVSLYGKADSATGSPTAVAYVSAGTQG